MGPGEVIIVILFIWALFASILAAVLFYICDGFYKDIEELEKRMNTVVTHKTLWGWIDRIGDEGCNLTGLDAKYDDPELVAIRERLATMIKDMGRYVQ